MAPVGRSTECAVITRLLAGARAGRGGSLLLTGPAGIGKSTLIDYATEAAAGMRVVAVRGVEPEAEIGYSALHRLLLPFRHRIDELPQPQRDGLHVALGLRDGPPPGTFLVGLATLTLLSAAASEQQVLLACDDAQWLDWESLNVLAFVGRRLDADALALLCAQQEQPDHTSPLRGLPELEVQELAPAAASAVLARSLDGPVDGVIRDRILKQVGGNPLAIQELARTIGKAAVYPGGALSDLVEGEPVSLDRRLRARVGVTARQLTPLAQTVLLTAAADGSGAQATVYRAVNVLTGAAPAAVAAAIEDAVQATLLVSEQRGTIRFRHPLIRAAVYGDARADRLREVHAALAAAADPDQPDRAAWHRAVGATAPDEEAAAGLERAAERTRSRGGFLSQASFLTRAAELSAAGPRRDSRLLAAAWAALTAGAPYHCEALLELLAPDTGAGPPAGAGSPGAGAPATEIAVAQLRANIANMLDRDGVLPLILHAARALRGTDPAAARGVLTEALAAAALARHTDDEITLRGVGREALEGGPLPADPSPAESLRVGHGMLMTFGFAPAAPVLRRALDAGPAYGAGNRGAACVLGIVAALELWDADALGSLIEGYLDAGRGQGAVRLTQVTVYGQMLHRVLCGRLAAASEAYDTLRDLTDLIRENRKFYLAHDVLLRAWEGDRARTEQAAAAQANLSAGQPASAVSQVARWALMVLAIGQGRVQDASRLGGQALDEDPPHLLGLLLPEIVEAAIRVEDRPLAERALEELSARVKVSATPWAAGLLARSRALLARPADAEQLYAEAVAHLGRTPLATELARAHLGYGEWLRRQRRRSDARTHLGRAYELFDRAGAVAFAGRASLELAAIGERVPERSAAATGKLTSQEARIARLAAGGATNAEIAAELFLSSHTVDYHLRKVFRKLNVSSRRELARRLPD